MNIDTIIFATDFSESSEAALQYATVFASAKNARLLIVHVDDETPGLVVGDVGYGYLPQIDRIAQEQLEQLEGIKPPSAGVVFEHHFLRGIAADEIIKFSQEQQADLIVIGTHGTSGIGQLLLGSVAEEIVRRAPCPVLTIQTGSRPLPTAEVFSESVAK